MNIMKTGILLAAMTALFMAVGFMIGGEAGMILALIVAGAMNFIGYWNSDKIVLSLHGARQIDPSSAPKLFSMVEQLSHAADLPTPKIYIIDNPQPNAFATGRNPQNAAVAATTGLLNLLSDDEVAGVMAHELAHIGNRDTLIMTIAATFAGAISMLANFGIFFGAGRNNNNVMGIAGMILLMILAPLAAMLVQMAISRSREYAADRKGAEICGNPSSLASALVKISAHAKGIVNDTAENHPATAHMFIINPLAGRNMANLFSTHPNTESRVEALNELALQRGAMVRQSEISAAQLTRGPSETPWSRAGTRYINKPAPGPWDRSPRR